jgi:hypothetical protein
MNRRQSKSIVSRIVAIKNLIGVAAAGGIVYLTIPWALVIPALSGELTVGRLNEVLLSWGTGLEESLPMVILLSFIVVLTLGPEALQLLFGGGNERAGPPPRI